MTRPLRKAHFIGWIVLSLFLSILVVAGLMARHASTTPVNPDLGISKREADRP